MNGVDKPGSVKAQIVKAIKAMLNSTQYINQVSKVKTYYLIIMHFLYLIN